MTIEQPKRHIARTLLIVAVLLVACVGGGFAYRARQAPAKDAQAQRPGPAPVSATVALATRRDVPIVLTGLGTVVASQTVAIHSQVDGKLQEVLFTEGQQVKKGDVLAKIDPRLFQAALDQAKARKAQDQAQLVAAQKDLTRFTTLNAKAFESQQNVDLQQAKVDQAKAAIASDEGAIEAAQTQLDYTNIVAPIDGRVGIRQLDVGNVVHASDQTSLVQMTQTTPIAVTFTLPGAMLDLVRDAQQRGPVEVLAYDRDNAKQLASGTLLLIDNQIDQTTATMRLKAMFDNRDDKLWPGEFVNARIKVDTKTHALTIPSAAIQRGPKGLFAWVVDGKGLAATRPLKVGASADDMTIVEDGVSEGDQVVTEGQYKLQPNAPVAIQNARQEAPSQDPAQRSPAARAPGQTPTDSKS